MFYTADDNRFIYSGRIDDEKKDAPVFAYPATNVRVRFKGTKVSAKMICTETDWRCFFGYFIDGQHGHQEFFYDGNEHEYLLGENLCDCWHELMIFKRQDQCHYMTFLGIDAEDIERPAENPEKKIEIIGDSISCGEVSEAVGFEGQLDPDCKGEFSNAYYSYGWILARKLNAEIHITSESGIALISNTGYFNQTAEDGSNAQGMEDCFDYIEFNRYLHNGEKKPWDFSRWTPDIVILALGQNDANPGDIMENDFYGEKANEWRRRYRAFIEKLMGLYPKAEIICTTAIMIHSLMWDAAIDKVVKEIASDRVHHFLYSRTASATPGHVRISEATEMADELKAFIDRMQK